MDRKIRKLICPAVQHITSTIPVLNNLGTFTGLMSIPVIILFVERKRYLISGLLIGTIQE
jgi:ABC-type maltose transport system permease subunit